MLLGTSLLGNILAGKRINKKGRGINKGIVIAGYGRFPKRMDF